ncbi:hypothetical protein K1T71_012474 [Dendrolimus kikuchii]|uniref:Uncharacterized protein n=1 Tax=Dendrolimus kikuchii TaxID=765133 RepID=A0ACC1CJU7_9NEOP|nr:hypothetical protein K1T71_012474 [Dendrolimus kikuchii]
MDGPHDVIIIMLFLDHPQVCSESSASESSLESSSGYGSQGAFAAEDHSHQHQVQHADAVQSEIVTLRRDSDASVAAARESFSISLGSLEEAVRSLDEATDSPNFATIGKKPAVPKRRPVSMTASGWSRRGSSSSVGKPPPPVRRSSSISRPQRQHYAQGAPASGACGDADSLPPPPAFLLHPENDNTQGQTTNVAETVKQLTELKHMPASPGLVRRGVQTLQTNQSSPTQPLSTFQQAKSNFSSTTSLNSAGNLNPIYGQTGHRIMAHENSLYARKNSLNNSNSDLYRDSTYGDNKGSPHGSSPSTPSYGENNSFSSFGPRVSNDSHYGQTGFKLQQEKKYGNNTIYAQPSEIIAGFNSMSIARHDTLSPLAMRKNIAARSHSADRHHIEPSGLIASLSAKLAPQLSPRTTRRAISSIAPAHETSHRGKVGGGSVPSAFLDKLSATIQQQRTRLDSHRATAVRDIINRHAQPDPRQCHTSLMEQIKRGATLRRNKHCNDRSAPKIR